MDIVGVCPDVNAINANNEDNVNTYWTLLKGESFPLDKTINTLNGVYYNLPTGALLPGNFNTEATGKQMDCVYSIKDINNPIFILETKNNYYSKPNTSSWTLVPNDPNSYLCTPTNTEGCGFTPYSPTTPASK